MNSHSLRFPSLMTSLQRNASHASQAALFTRYTPDEWYQRQIKHFNEADSHRFFSERMRNDAIKTIREAEERVQNNQYDTGRRLGERITDVTFWRNEVASELEKMIQESERLQDSRRALEKAVRDTYNPLHITEECLYHREARKGTELVHDETEKSLFREVENLQACKKNLEDCLDRCKNQIRNCRISQNQLELDLKNKENALGIDTICHHLSNHSHGLEYYLGIEKYDPCVSDQESWTQAANKIIQKSQTERTLSCQLRSDAESLLNRVAQEIWSAWNNTNSALTRRSTEMLEAKSKLQQHLHKLQQEIFDLEKNMDLTRKAIADKSYALKVGHTRLEARMHRPDLELCRDNAHTSLQKEIEDIQRQVDKLKKVLRETENQHQRLIRTRSTLEHDLALKMDAMHIDREKVSGLRRAFPVNSLFRF